MHKQSSNPQTPGNNGGQSLYRVFWAPGSEQEHNCPDRKENIPKMHLCPTFEYYAIEFPQNSYAGRRINWCQPEGTHVSRKENPLSADNCQITLEEQPEPWQWWSEPQSDQDSFRADILLTSIPCQDPKDALGRAGSVDLSVLVPSMGSLKWSLFPCFSLLFIQLSYWGRWPPPASGCCQGQSLDHMFCKRTSITLAEVQGLFEFRFQRCLFQFQEQGSLSPTLSEPHIMYYLTDFSFS